MKSSHEPNRDNMEIELKLLVAPADMEHVRRHPLLEQYATAKPYVQEMTSTYFDTPDLHVRRRNAALRVRKVDHGWVQTLKGGGKVDAGLHQRNEWEGRIDGSSLDLPALRDMLPPHSRWAKLLSKPSFAEQLVPLFTTRVTRTIWELRLPEGDEIEFALDRGTVEHEELSEPISEIELELKSGDPQHLFRLAMQLSEFVPLRAGNISKAERGYALASPSQPSVVKATPLELSPQITAEQGFQAIVTNCIAQIQGNETGVSERRDSESVHQMRVGLRRLRSALGLYKDLVALPATMQEELDWLGSQLGPARDWDVLAASTLAAVEHAASDDTGVEAVQRAASDIAHEKREQASAAVKSVRYARLMLAFSGWMVGAGWRGELDEARRNELDAPIRNFADRMLVHGQHRLLRRGRHLHGPDSVRRHRVRIAAKKSRYATEFFESLYRPKRVNGYVESLSALQDELGWLNDAAVGQGLLAELQETRPELAAGAGFARGYLASVAAHEDRKLHKLWKRFEPLKPPSRK